MNQPYTLLDSLDWNAKWRYIFQNGTLLSSMKVSDQDEGHLFALIGEPDEYKFPDVNDFAYAEVIIRNERTVTEINHDPATRDQLLAKYADELEKLIKD